MEEQHFRASGYPTNLEWYKCYRNQTLYERIDATELENNPDWDAKQIDRWRFFYRLDPTHLGDPQRQYIQTLRREIKNEESDYAYLKKKAEDNFKFHSQSVETEIRNLNRKTSNTIATCIALMLVLFYFAENYAILPIIYIILHLAYTLRKKKDLKNSIQKRESQKDREIAEMREKAKQRIKAKERKIHELEDEIRILQTKIPDPPDIARMEADLLEEIQHLERCCLGEIVYSRTDPADFDEQPDNNLIERFNREKLIQGWGLLQQPTIQGPFGIEKTGLERVRRELGAKIATWRTGTQKQPIFRVLYLQYIFLLKKCISMYGFFYDIVSRKRYGIRSEIFHYNHIANFSIKAAELEVPDWLKELNLPEKFLKNLFGREVNIFSLTVSSGTHFRCTLIDEAVFEAMNNWLRETEKNTSEKPLNPVQADKNYVHIANEILKQVREGIEQYAYYVSPVNAASRIEQE